MSQTTPCGGCGRPTPYAIATANGYQPCCGRVRCEAKVRDGEDLPEPSRRLSIHERELGRVLQEAIERVPCSCPNDSCWVCRGFALLEASA